MRLSFLAALLLAGVVAAGTSVAQPSPDPSDLNQSDPFLEEDELFENASDPFARYDEAAQEAENVTLVDPAPVATEDEDAEDDPAPPPEEEPGTEEERSIPGPGVVVTLASLAIVLLGRRRR